MSTDDFPGVQSFQLQIPTPTKHGGKLDVETVNTKSVTGMTSTTNIDLDTAGGMTILSTNVNITADRVTASTDVYVGNTVACANLHIIAPDCVFRFVISADNELFLEKTVGNVVTLLNVAS
jgi:hypothetical protein